MNTDLDAFGFLSPAEKIRPLRPKKLRPEFNTLIFDGTAISVRKHLAKLLSEGWRVYVADQRCGWCVYSARVIILPSWLCTSHKSASYRNWYISHEIAHAIDKCEHDHGPEFMKILKAVCPPEDIHWEITYKPRNAKAAGIGIKQSFDLGEF